MARESKKTSRPFNWRLLFGVVILAAVGVSTAMAGYKVRRYVITDPQFNLSRDRKDAITIQGLVYASRWKVQRVFAADFGHSIFAIPLEERRRRLLAIDWIEDASVSRIWPDRIVVRVRERKPIAFVAVRTGVLLIDSHGVLLDQPAQAQFSFPVLSGIREDESEVARRERVRAFLDFQSDMGYLSKEVSEVDAADPDNIRVVAQVDHRAVTLLMGEGNFARRYQNFVAHYPDIRKRSPEAKAFDLRLDDRITVKE
ncbi:MAG TPA: FtsQ-type POTRA domain-containing protein [Candidatus Acidoferrales bacterium]|nr:FtsQ-type POTRA domain-containing protein [Candidatus Acidoferrales bacterium]